MVNKPIFSLLIFSFSMIYSWQREYGGVDTPDFGNSVKQTPDGGYIFTGHTYTDSGEGYNIIVIKTNALGDIEWSNDSIDIEGGYSSNEGYAVELAGDGGYVIAGRAFCCNEYLQAVLIKLDSHGNQVWFQDFGSNGRDKFNDVRKTNDGGFILTGYREPDFYSPGNLWLLKTDSSGEQVWSRTFYKNNFGEGYSVIQTSDNGYIFTGEYSINNIDLYIIKTDSLGNEEWSNLIGGENRDTGTSIQQTDDGGYIVLGYTNSWGNGGNDAYLIKLDVSGNQEWARTIGDTTNEAGYSVRQTTDGGFILAGDKSTKNFDDFWLVKTDYYGQVEWDSTYGGNNQDRARSMEITNDNGYIIVGHSIDSTWQSQNILLIKTDSKGSLSVGEGFSLPEMFTLFPNYPNPFNSSTTITYDIPEQSHVTLIIYDLLGRTVKTLINDIQSSNNNTVEWDGKNSNGKIVPSGIYIYYLKAGKFQQSKKMVMMK